MKSPMSDNNNQIALDILRLSQAGKLDPLEEFWLENLDNIPTRSGFIRQWLECLFKVGGGRKRGETLVHMLLEDRINQKKWKASMRLLLAALRAWPSQEKFRPLLVGSLRGYYAKLDLSEEFIAFSGVEAGAPMPEGFKTFRELTRLVPGRVHSHYDWGEGIIQSLDLSSKKVVLDFPDQPGKAMTIEGVKKYLKPLETDSFLARRAKEPGILKELASTSPCELVKLAVFGNREKALMQSNLKLLLTPSLIEPGKWNTWWGKAREKLKLDPFIDLDNSGGARAVLRLREKPRTFEQEIEEQFFSAEATIGLQSKLISQLARRSKDSEPPAELALKIHHYLVKSWERLSQSTDENQVKLLELAFMTSDLADAVPEAEVEPLDPAPLLETISDYTVCHEFQSSDHIVRVLQALMDRDGSESIRNVIRLLPDAELKTGQFIVKTIQKNGDVEEASAAIQKLLAKPMSNPETYHWVVKWILEGSWTELAMHFPASSLILDMISSLDDWHRWANDSSQDREVVKTSKLLLSKIRSLLQAGKFKYIGKAVENMPISRINQLIRLIRINDALGTAAKEGAERMIRIVRRDLEKDESDPSTSEPDLHQCTARSLAEKTMELRDLKSNRIPENSKVIGSARAEGDLKENAGYQYAKEEQKRLVQQQASLSILLGQAVIVDSVHIDSSKIGFGTRFKAKNLITGECESYTVLGRWETDPDHYVLSIQSPLAQQFLDSCVQDSITVDHPGGGSTSYEILEISNALESGEWDEDKARVPAASS
jgi:transcription elongation GreA/GreB family factor